MSHTSPSPNPLGPNTEFDYFTTSISKKNGLQTNHIRPRYPSTYRDVVQLSEAESQLLQSLLNEFAHMNDDNYWPKARQAVLRAFWNTGRARPPEPSA